MSRSGARTGVVVEFDEAVGLGRVEGSSGSFGFHCTQIAGGSRRIEVGARVTFTVVPARLGAWEAAELAAAGCESPQA